MLKKKLRKKISVCPYVRAVPGDYFPTQVQKGRQKIWKTKDTQSRR